MRLNTRFLWLRSAILLVFAGLVWIAFGLMEGALNEQWGTQFAQRQVLFDKYRTLSPLIREIALARQMAIEPALIEMALHDDDLLARRRGLNLMERYRPNFSDRSYFAAFVRSGRYYFNDAANQFSGRQYRYTLSPREKNDQWFYATVKRGRDYQVNLDPDMHLGVVKVWINVLLKHGDEVLGVIGTGLDLSDFLQKSVSLNQPGIHNFFVDRSLAIQLSAEPGLIDYASIAKEVSDRRKIDTVLKNPEDLRRLQAIARELESRPSSAEVRTLWVDFRGAPHLLGVAYLPEIGWFDLTLMDKKSLAVIEGFGWFPVLFALIFFGALLLMHVFLQRWVLEPLGLIQQKMETIRRGNYQVDLPQMGIGEVAELADAFRHMVKVARQTNQDLERKIRERTEDLQRLTEVDPLTGLLNRRGMTARFEQEIARQSRQGGSMGMMLLDLDHFKQVNDTHGHAAGDLALCAVANILGSMKRSYDYAGRWGGEEFLLLLPQCSEQDLRVIAERIRTAVAQLQIESGAQSFSLTVSIGIYFSATPQTLDAMLQQVDRAMYAAKAAGRNCFKSAAATEQST